MLTPFSYLFEDDIDRVSHVEILQSGSIESDRVAQRDNQNLDLSRPDGDLVTCARHAAVTLTGWAVSELTDKAASHTTFLG